jgi:hypothetical protein
VVALTDMLKAYCEGSGQRINLDKSSIYFGAHCTDQVKVAVKNLLGVQSEALNDLYLGMPTYVGHSLGATFKFLLDRIWKRLSGCIDRPLSHAGNETFIKSVIQAIPAHVMSCFQLPLITCDSFKSVIANRWWGVENGKKKMRWRSWEWLSTPKTLGGHGFP